MQNRTKRICIVGGLYFVISYIINILQGIFYSYNRYDVFADCLGIVLSLFGTIFVILFFLILFGKQVYFLDKFIDICPNISIYLYYIGYIGYILLVFDILILIPTMLMSLSEITQQYLTWLIVCINVVGAIIALVLASKAVFFKNKTMQK